MLRTSTTGAIDLIERHAGRSRIAGLSSVLFCLLTDFLPRESYYTTRMSLAGKLVLARRNLNATSRQAGGKATFGFYTLTRFAWVVAS